MRLFQLVLILSCEGFVYSLPHRAYRKADLSGCSGVAQSCRPVCRFEAPLVFAFVGVVFALMVEFSRSGVGVSCRSRWLVRDVTSVREKVLVLVALPSRGQ